MTNEGPFPNQSPFIWHELVTADQRTSGEFYSQLFGWAHNEVDAGRFGTYTLFQKDGRDVAGMMSPMLAACVLWQIPWEPLHTSCNR